MKIRKLTHNGVTYKLHPNGEICVGDLPVACPDELERVRKLFAQRARAAANRAARDDAMRSMGLTKVRGAVTGRIYWE